jgi:hypothetical protein
MVRLLNFWIQFENPATPAKGTKCFRSFSIGNDLFTTGFTAQMGRGKIQWGFTRKYFYPGVVVQKRRFVPRTVDPMYPRRVRTVSYMAQLRVWGRGGGSRAGA